MWNFDDLFDGGEYGDRSILKPIDCLDAFLDVVACVSFGNELLNFDDLIAVNDDLLDLSTIGLHSYNFLLEGRNL
jgi:hypothetical protein